MPSNDRQAPVSRPCPNCGAELAFHPGSGGSHGRSFAHCRACGHAYTLYGGTIAPVAEPGRTQAS